MANFFDQFDEAQTQSSSASPKEASGNFFDQFDDTPAATQSKGPVTDKDGNEATQFHIRKASELSFEQKIPFDQALQQVMEEETGFFEGAGRSFLLGAGNRLRGIGQATGMDKGVGKVLKTVGAIPEDADVEGAVQESITENRSELEAIKQDTVGGHVGEFLGEAAVLAPAAFAAPASGVIGLTAAGAATGAAEGLTRSEGVGEERDRLMDGAFGALGGAAFGLLGGKAAQAYNRYLSPRVNKAMNTFGRTAKSKLDDLMGHAKVQGEARFSMDGRRILERYGFDPRTVDNSVADDILGKEVVASSDGEAFNRLLKLAKKTDTKAARDNLARFERIGVEPTLGQVTQDPGILRAERSFGLSGIDDIAEPIVGKLRVQGEEQLPASTKMLIENISEEGLDNAAERVVGVANRIVRKITTERQRKGAPLYEYALNPSRQVDEQALNALKQNNARIDNVLKSVKKDIDFKNKIGDAPDNSMIVLQQAKEKMDNLIGKATRAGENKRAGLLIESKDELVSLMDDATRATQDIPELGVKAGDSVYAKARDVWTDYSGALDKIRNTELGALADLADGKLGTVSKRVFSLKRDKDFGRMKDLIRSEDPDVWNALVADHIDDVFRSTMAEADPSAKLYRGLWQSRAQRERMAIAFEGDAKRLDMFEDLMKGVKQLRSLGLVGSDTHTNQQVQKSLEKLFGPKSAQIAERLNLDVIKDLAKDIQESIGEENMARAARLTTNQESIRKFLDAMDGKKVASFTMSERGRKLAERAGTRAITNTDRLVMAFYSLRPEIASEVVETVGSSAVRTGGSKLTGGNE